MNDVMETNLSAPALLKRTTPAWVSVLMVVVCWSLWEVMTAAQTPAAPDSLVHDDTRFFGETQAKNLSARLMEARQKLGVPVYVAAMTYASDKSARETAGRLAASWAKGQATVVIVRDRGKAQSGVAVSREFWERYPADEVVRLGEGVAALLVRQETTAEQNVSDAVLALIPRLSKMESARVKRAQNFTRQEMRLGAAMGAGLVVLLMVGLIALKVSRHREASRAKQYLFPEVEVASRLGAPFGGGTIGESWSRR